MVDPTGDGAAGVDSDPACIADSSVTSCQKKEVAEANTDICLRSPIGNNGVGRGSWTKLSDTQVRTAIGITLGAASIPLGIGAVAGASVVRLTGAALGGAAVDSGVTGPLADYPACSRGDAAACLGAGLGLGGSALGFFGALLGLNATALDLIFGMNGVSACW